MYYRNMGACIDKTWEHVFGEDADMLCYAPICTSNRATWKRMELSTEAKYDSVLDCIFLGE